MYLKGGFQELRETPFFSHFLLQTKSSRSLCLKNNCLLSALASDTAGNHFRLQEVPEWRLQDRKSRIKTGFRWPQNGDSAGSALKDRDSRVETHAALGWGRVSQDGGPRTEASGRPRLNRNVKTRDPPTELTEPEKPKKRRDTPFFWASAYFPVIWKSPTMFASSFRFGCISRRLRTELRLTEILRWFKWTGSFFV